MDTFALRRVSGMFKITSLMLVLLFSPIADAERLKDLAGVQGVRQNQLMGYGLVVGLDGSGDQTTQTPFTVQSIVSMMQQLGVSIPVGTSLQLKNVAAVMVTTSLQPFSQPGQTLDVTVSSMGNAKSLKGGTLLMTPLKGADNQIYAMAQGNVLVGAVGAAPAGGKAQVNHLSVGKITGGATVERAVPSLLGHGNTIQLELNTSDFSTASRVVDAINKKFGAETAAAVDGRVIQVRAPQSNDLRVNFLGQLESIDVIPAQNAAKVILNARTGSIVMNQAVSLESCAIAHGNLSVVINADSPEAQANPAIKEGGSLLILKAGVSLSEVVKALNAIGATPQDLLAILQAMKASGALRADLEII